MKTQQLVRVGDKRFLTDLYFPQFNIHLEIDERHHLSEENDLKNKYRTRDIIGTTDHHIERIAEGKLLSVNLKVDQFVDKIINLKKCSKDFVPWNFDDRYNPLQYIKIGEIDCDNNVVFQFHRQAAQCFGYDKGHIQRGVWNVPGHALMLWFPRLYETQDWENSLINNGETIVERRKENPNKHLEDILEGKHRNERVVFAKAKDALGYSLLRYVGNFILDEDKTVRGNDTVYYKRVKTTQSLND